MVRSCRLLVGAASCERRCDEQRSRGACSECRTCRPCTESAMPEVGNALSQLSKLRADIGHAEARSGNRALSALLGEGAPRCRPFRLGRAARKALGAGRRDAEEKPRQAGGPSRRGASSALSSRVRLESRAAGRGTPTAVLAALERTELAACPNGGTNGFINPNQGVTTCSRNWIRPRRSSASSWAQR